jgi:hypothetical protein
VKEESYTVMVPVKEERMGTRKVYTSVPVKKTRTVCQDQGHWDEKTVATPCGGCASHHGSDCGCRAKKCGGCASCNGCGGCGATATTTCRVWVPNMVETQVEYTAYECQASEEQYTYHVTVCKPEAKTRKVQVVRHVQEEVAYKYNVTVCKPETRTRKVQVVSHVNEEVAYKYNVTVCKPETRTRKVHVVSHVNEEVAYKYNVTVCKPEQKTAKVMVSKLVPVEETYTYNVHSHKTEQKEVDVQVCRMVEKVVEHKVWHPAAVACDGCAKPACSSCK